MVLVVSMTSSAVLMASRRMVVCGGGGGGGVVTIIIKIEISTLAAEVVLPLLATVMCTGGREREREGSELW